MALLDQFGRPLPTVQLRFGFVPTPLITPPKPQTCSPADAIASTTIPVEE